MHLYRAALSGVLCLFILTGASFGVRAQSAKHKKYVVIGYVGGYRGLVDTALVDAQKLTHINYAFVNVQNNRAWLTNLKTDSTNFRNLNKLKLKNPGLKILISIGGWLWSGNFSDAVLSDTSRRAFAASAVQIIRDYGLDGVDIDWEYPAQAGAGNKFRPEDQQNYTLMFKSLREELDQAEKQTGRNLLLTTAVGGFKRFLDLTEMGKAQAYLDYINLMTYDYFQDSLGVAVHHTNLYPSKMYTAEDNADKTVKDYIAAGVPAAKLVMGLAFYGRSSIVAENSQNGLGVKTTGKAQAGGYTMIKDSLINKKGFKYYRDKDAKAPYLYNPSSRQFISFDDEWSVKNKAEYVKDKKMGGLMFWEYTSDTKEYLLDELNKVLGK
ncbi:glycoside hydrolase family 18 protein [Pedobacter sp. MC2016-15]|uniref:glycoside hydrolase family 18 protein n=1 Tax=Pedobacter sp. MC2016-15 TaxID=2994473 RepID=UPI0022471EF9|nr:glycoside hydrolase family 18 protein [Pedobacter sp. MC2016-15]MCX2479768.1 glycoside hydrolase family 18 protein [Pedobacter sp. MC2016-15]